MVTYQGEKTYKESCMLPQLIVSSAAKITELLKLGSGFITIINHIGHISSQYKWSSVPMCVVYVQLNLAFCILSIM